MEKITASQFTAICRAHHVLDTHSIQLRDLNRHMEDLDNCDRCHNLRLWGLPKAEVINLFNTLLEKPCATPIGMKCIHRVLRPQGRKSDPPRDVVCCIIDYQLKEEIPRKARSKIPLSHNGVEIRLFQDISTIMLQRRQELHPLLEVLRTKGIPYRWKFLFCLPHPKATQHF